MYKLVIQDDEGKTTVVPLVRDEITVGRKEGNTIRLTERNVSRRHARIVRSNGSIAIEDLESYNGVRVNGARIQGRQPLSTKDQIQIGDYVIAIKTEGAASTDDSVKEPHTGPTAEPVTAAAAESSSSVPIQQDASDPDAQTVKMPAQMLPLVTAEIEAAPEPAAAVATAVAIDDPTPPPPITPAVAAQPESGQPARITVLSANFAGAEFPLTEPAMVIGRTEDNDIVIDHRSISRHHAKIVRENEHYVIVDLQSSNGVRVNGEDYGKVELRRGDIIDLGHVRMRFADPEDDYVFTPEDVNEVTTRSGKGMWYALLAAVVILGCIGIFALSRPDGAAGTDPANLPPRTAHPNQPEVPGQVPEKTPGQVQTPSQTPTDATPSPARSTDDPETLLKNARDALAQRKWAHAQVAADKILEDDSGNRAAKDIKQTARQEILNEAHYQELLRVIEDKEYGGVAGKLDSIAKSSVYRAQAQEAHDAALEAYVSTEVLPEAQRLLEERKCAQLQSYENRVRRQWSAAAGQLPDIVSECRAEVRASNRNNSRSSGGSGQQNNQQSSGDNDPPPDPGKSFDELLSEAKDAAKINLYGKALRLCSDALKLKPGDQEAVSVCAIAACGMGNQKQAKRYQKMAIGARQNQIAQVCMLKGVDLRQ